MVPVAPREREFQELASLFNTEGVKSFLEIGSKHGDSLRTFAAAIPPGSKIVSIDLPQNESSWKALYATASWIKEKYGHEVKSHLGDSTDLRTIRWTAEQGPYDALFIDANHTLPYVISDWVNYGPLARIVSFHDINHTKTIATGRMAIEAKSLWDSLKAYHRHQEFKYCNGINGIGVLWH